MSHAPGGPGRVGVEATGMNLRPTTIERVAGALHYRQIGSPLRARPHPRWRASRRYRTDIAAERRIAVPRVLLVGLGRLIPLSQVLIDGEIDPAVRTVMERA